MLRSSLSPLLTRRSTINFASPPTQIPPATLNKIVNQTMRSPTAFNLQPFTCVLLDSQNPSQQAMKERLSTSAAMGPGNKRRFTDCSMLAVFLSDLNPSSSDRLNRVIEVEESEGSPRQFNDGYLASLPVLTEFLGKGSVLKNLVLPLVSDSGHAATVEIEGTEAWCNKSVGMAVMGFVIGCEEAGLGSCVMEGYDARRIREALNVPGGRAERRWGVPCVVAVGECGDERSFGSGNVVLTKRLDVDEVFFSGSFGVGYDCDVKE
ncbi:hypothetical protein ScalyP_jg10187 [Parmales sp. scaly parma]|nr:hypothetical protein ScalyP_jg10187 [Parmales sp. scaly parma]